MRVPGRLTLLPILLLLCSWGAARAGTWHAGVRAGTDYAKFHGEGANLGFAYQQGLVAGFVLEYRASPQFSLLTEATYSRKGARPGSDFRVEDYAGRPFSGSITLDYIGIPILARWSLSRSSVRPYLLAGPSADVLTDARARAGGASVAYLADVRRLDWGLAGGAGLEVRDAGRSYVVEVRYTTGFQGVYLHEDPGRPQLINHAWQLTLAMLI